MSSLYWVDGDLNKAFARFPVARLVKSYLNLETVTPAVVNQIFRLSSLLLLSNHIEKAQELITALYKLANDHIDHDFPPASALQVLWQTHPTLPRPENAGSLVTDLPREQWGKYRECTRTGWMLDRYGTAEPEDPHIWRETDDPAVIAICARLLAKTLEPGTYPPPDRMREALEAAQKLYAQPEVNIVEYQELLRSVPTGQWQLQDKIKFRRQSHLVYRRLAIELAIRLGEFQTAADILSQALRVDGIKDEGSVDVCLIFPGIYDVLPLLAQGGKESNPYYITEEDADGLVEEVIKALEIRAASGRQWELAADKVGWRELLDRLAAGAWKLHREEYEEAGVMSAEDILYPPATENEIQAAEAKVGELPKDFKEMVMIANGFKGGWHSLSGGIAGIRDISLDPEEDMNMDDYEFENAGFIQEGDISGQIICLQPGVECDMFFHYIVPPAFWKANVVGREVEEGEYRYWHTAYWQHYIHPWLSVRHWVASCVEELEDEIERGAVEDSPKP